MRLTALTLGTSAAFAALSNTSSGPTSCSICTYAGLLPDNAAVVSAVHVEAGGSYGEGPANVAYPVDPTELPELCALTVTVSSSPTSFFRFGVFLPAEWNGRFLAVGNGGLSGGINWMDMGYGVRHGMAVVSTDTGHNSTAWDVKWAFRSEERRKDWGFRSMHGTVELGKKIVESYYSTNISYSYYSGTSTGGRQGLMEIQRYPGSFDGALLGAPAWWVSHLSSSGSYYGAINLPVGAPNHIPTSFLSTLEAEVIKQCDHIDGVEDGIVSAPELCNFDITALACGKACPASNNATKCLNPAQIKTVQAIYSNYSIDGQFIYPGMELSSEKEWTGSVVQDNDRVNEYINYFLLDDPHWTWDQFHDGLVLDAMKRDPGNSTPDNFEGVATFVDRGGKMITFHGLSDGIIVPKSTLVLREFIANATAGKGQLGDWYRLFMAPGMQHSAGTAVGAPWYIAGAGQARRLGTGPGPRELDDVQHNGLLALIEWVEKGRAVDEIVATSWKNDTDANSGILRQRPWCAFPRKQVFTGGDEKKAESWECT